MTTATSATDPADTPTSATRHPSRRIAGRVTSVLRRPPVMIGLVAVLLLSVTAGAWAIIDARKLTVPTLVGLPLSDVDQAFDGLDLKPVRQGDPPDKALLTFTTVTGQTPPAGSRVFPGREVAYTFKLSSVDIPDVTGDTLAASLEKLRKNGLAGEATSAQIPIVADTDTSGAGLHATTDPAMVTAAVASLGLTGNIDASGAPFVLHGTASDDWTVVATKPAPGKWIKAGSKVELTVVLPLGEMPNVVGKTYRDASTTLSNAGATATLDGTPHFGGVVPDGFPFDIKELAYSWWGGTEKDTIAALVGTPDGWPVRSQSVPPGIVITRGKTTASLVVEWPTTTVPNIVGMSKPDAQKALNNAGLAGHDIYGDGITRAQSVDAGTVLPMGAKVDAAVTHEVTFRVTATSGRATVSWAAPGSFSIAQEGGAALPWSKSWYPGAAPDRYDRGNFNAQSSGSGSITCEIVIDGQVVVTQTSTGAYAVVSCG